MMHATLSVKALRDAMAKVGRAVDRRTAIPILGAFRLTVTGDKLTICGTDIDIMASISVPVAEARDGAICVSARILTLVRSLPNFDTIRLREVEDRRLVIDLPDGRVSFIGIDPGEFPDLLPKGEIAAAFDMPSSDLVAALERVRPFISTEETRYYLNGVFFHATQDDEMRLAATDGHKLGRITLPFAGSFPEKAGILPTGAVAFLLKALPRGVVLKITFFDSYRAMFTTEDGSFSLISKLIDGTFPDYNRVIPKKASGVFEILPAQWRAKIARIVGFSRCARFARDAKTGRASVSATHPECGELIVALGAKHIKGQRDFSVGLNATSLDATLRPHRCETATMRFVDASSPIVFESAEFLSVIMPARIGDGPLDLPEGCEP